MAPVFPVSWKSGKMFSWGRWAVGVVLNVEVGWAFIFRRVCAYGGRLDCTVSSEA
jgi:hypothetical protein